MYRTVQWSCLQEVSAWLKDEKAVEMSSDII